MVLGYFGVHLEEDAMCLLLGTTQWGATRFRDLANVEAEGFTAIIRPGEYGDLRSVYARGVPVIAGIDTRHLAHYPHAGGPHSIVVAGATDTEVTVFDPDLPMAPNHYNASEFMSAWGARDCRLAIVEPR